VNLIHSNPFKPAPTTSQITSSQSPHKRKGSLFILSSFFKSTKVQVPSDYLARMLEASSQFLQPTKLSLPFSSSSFTRFWWPGHVGISNLFPNLHQSPPVNKQNDENIEENICIDLWEVERGIKFTLSTVIDLWTLFCFEYSDKLHWLLLIESPTGTQLKLVQSFIKSASRVQKTRKMLWLCPFLILALWKQKRRRNETQTK
jgi:hypothetical protein